MKSEEFEKIKSEFEKADVDGKIMMYVGAEGLDGEQYRQLLKMFPVDQLQKLEEALG